MKILITGAAGFIGFYAVKAFLERGCTVVGIDNLSDYYNVNLKFGRLAECGIDTNSLSENERIESGTTKHYFFQKADLTDYSMLENLFSRENFDYVIHLAAQPGVRYSLRNPHTYIQSNVVGFMNILECCRHYKVKHLVYASSSSVYGMSSKTPFNEDDKTDHPISIYAATKKSNELMAHTYSHLFQLPTTGLRFFTVYGPWGRPDMAPMLFADAIASRTPIKVFNQGDMQRDFTYVKDIVEGIVRILDNIPGRAAQIPHYRIFNIGNSKPIKLMDFIWEMEIAFGMKAKLEMHPMQPGDVKVTYADTSKLQRMTGYKPQTTLKEGVGHFVKWYKRFNNC